MRKIYGYCRISTPYQNIERQIRNILKEFPDAIIIQETFTGSVFQRRIELEKLIRNIKAGDTIVFDSVSRMSSSADEGFRLYEELYNQGVNLVFLKEPHMNTATYRKTLQEKQILLTLYSEDEATDKLMKSILDAINDYVMSLAKKQIQFAFIQSQKEFDDLHQHAREGMETAYGNGKQIGQKQGNRLHIRKSRISRKKSPVQQLILKYSKAFNGTNYDKEVVAIINASPDPADKSKKLHVSMATYYKYKAELRETLSNAGRSVS